jgi:hypothetical protein
MVHLKACFEAFATKMPSLVESINNPIFIVGSPRSGTSILTYCLGQHPNILFQEESDWLGPFSVDAAVSYRRGSARGPRGQLSAIGVGREEFLECLGKSVNDLVLSHREYFQKQRAQWDVPPFTISRSLHEPKSRWVDGAPENSLYVCGLRKLFPQAQFVHLVRDVTEVVRSLLNFFPADKDRLVANEQAAYEDWLHRVTCCLEAEQAYGPDVVYRMRYSDMVDRPDSAMRSLLDFLGEPYTPQCLEPLVRRINTANASVNFNATDPATDAAIVEQAKKLSDDLQSSPQRCEASPAAAVAMETAFEKRVQYVATVDSEYQRALRVITTLQKETAQRTAGCASDRVTQRQSEGDPTPAQRR